MLQRRTVVQASLAGGLIATLAGLAEIGKQQTALGPTDGAGWRPIDWPFPRDGWPPGRAWRQRDGTEVYVRPKLGFCGNCDTGVVTDEEVDRVTDIDLLDEKFAPLREGSRVRITDLFGRARLYRLKMKDGKPRLAEGIAVSYKCDLVVAIVLGKVDDEPTAKFAHAFIESNKVQVWLNQQLEGR
jgi:hypothetical protein